MGVCGAIFLPCHISQTRVNIKRAGPHFYHLQCLDLMKQRPSPRVESSDQSSIHSSLTNLSFDLGLSNVARSQLHPSDVRDGTSSDWSRDQDKTLR